MANQFQVPDDRPGGYLPSNIPQFSGQYFKPQFGATNDGTLAGTADQLTLAAGYISNSVLVDRIGAIVTGAGEAGSLVRLGIYNDNGAFYPGTLLLDAGTILGDSGTAQEIAVSLRLAPGWYWFGGAMQSAPTTRPTMRVVAASTPGLRVASLGGTLGSGSARHYGQSGVTGALPATFTSTLAAGTMCPIIALRIA